MLVSSFYPVFPALLWFPSVPPSPPTSDQRAPTISRIKLWWPWWQVDLGESIRINEVYLHDRQDCCRTLGGSFKIMLLDAEQVLVDEMNVNGIAREGSFTFDDVLARYVKIERVYWNGRISLSEVEVYGSEQVTPGSLGDGL